MEHGVPSNCPHPLEAEHAAPVILQASTSQRCRELPNHQLAATPMLCTPTLFHGFRARAYKSSEPFCRRHTIKSEIYFISPSPPAFWPGGTTQQSTYVCMHETNHTYRVILVRMYNFYNVPFQEGMTLWRIFKHWSFLKQTAEIQVPISEVHIMDNETRNSFQYSSTDFQEPQIWAKEDSSPFWCQMS